MRAELRHLAGEKRASSAVAAELFFSFFAAPARGTGQGNNKRSQRPKDLRRPISLFPQTAMPGYKRSPSSFMSDLAQPESRSRLPCLRTSPEKGVRMVAQTPPRQNVVRENERDPPRREHVEREGHPVSRIRRPAIGRRRGSPGCRNQEAR